MRRLVTMLGATLLLAAPDEARGARLPLSLPARASDDSVARGRPARRPATPRPLSTSIERARPGETIPVEITYYCLKGRTRTNSEVREGIVAADPRVFPLHRHVALSVRGRPLGRFLVADTGGKIKGRILDIWVPSCADARRRGRHRATAVLLTRAESRGLLLTP